MARLKKITGKLRIAPILKAIARLEVSNDGFAFDLIDEMEIEVNSVPNIYSFPNHIVADIDNPDLTIRISTMKYVAPSTTSTTSTTSTSSTSSTSTTSSTTTSTSSSTSTSTTSSTTSTTSTSTSSTTSSTSSTTTSTSSTSSTTTSTSSSTTTTSTSTSSTTTSSSTTSSSTTTTTTTQSPTTTTTTTLGSASARFNFNNYGQNTPGWIDFSGDPDLNVVTKTDTPTGITLTSMTGKWGNFGGTSNNTNGGTGANADFPANVMISYWYNYSLVYANHGANMKLTNLIPNASYQLKMIGSRSSTTGSGIPAGVNRIMEFIVSQSGSVGHASEQSNLSYAARDSITTQAFTINSNASGEIYLGVYCSRNGNGTNGDQFGYINGLIVTKL